MVTASADVDLDEPPGADYGFEPDDSSPGMNIPVPSRLMTSSDDRRRPVPRRATQSRQADAELTALVLRRFRIVFHAIRTHSRQVKRDVGASGAQVWALLIVRENPGVGITSLAAAMHVRQPTASNLVKQLVQRNLVEVRRDGSDGRVVQLHATAAGRRVLNRVPGPPTGVLPAALAGLAPDTLRRLDSDLAALIRRLGLGEAGGDMPLSEL